MIKHIMITTLMVRWGIDKTAMREGVVRWEQTHL